MSDYTNSDKDYIEDKVNSTNSSDNTSNTPNYRRFITTILSSMIQAIILFCISAGFIVNTRRDLYKSNKDGTSIFHPPYYDKSGQSNGEIKHFFDLTKVTFPYNKQYMKTFIEYECKRVENNGDAWDSSTNVSDTWSKATLWKWGIRMTSESYIYMRLFQKLLLDLVGEIDKEKITYKSNAIFAGMGILLIFIFFSMYWLAPIMTIVGAFNTFIDWAYLHLVHLWMLWIIFLPGLFYTLGIFVVPLIAATINSYIQPLYYLAILFEPIFKCRDDVKRVMSDHSHIISLVGIIITIFSAINNSGDSIGFVTGVVLISIIAFTKIYMHILNR